MMSSRAYACHIVAALFPPLTDEREVRIELTGLFAPFAFGKGSSLDPPLDRAMTDSYTASQWIDG
jgi:hypothetical protein